VKFIPYERFIIRSSFTADEALEKLSKYVEPKEPLRWLGVEPTKRYEGDIKNFNFDFSRAVYRSWLYPKISGKIESEPDGCSVYFSIYPDALMLAFMVQWLGLTGLIFFSILVSFISSTLGINKGDSASIEGLLGFGGLFGIGYIFFVGIFKAESGVTKEFFKELFKAKETKEIDFIGLFKSG
jgi:hypothetical protein